MTRPSNDVVLDSRATGAIIARWFENFDPPVEPAAAVATVELPPGPTELELARQQGWNEGFLAACCSDRYLAERADAHGTARLLSQLEALEQRMAAAAEVNATAMARWLGEALEAIVPSLLQNEAEKRVAATATVLHQALRSMGRLEVRDPAGAAITCSTAHEAGRALVRLRDEDPDAGGITINWPDGRMDFDDRRTWTDIQAAILPVTIAGPASVTPPMETAQNAG